MHDHQRAESGERDEDCRPLLPVVAAMACLTALIPGPGVALPTRVCDFGSADFHLDYRESPAEEPVFYLARIFAMNPNDDRDQDKDGLVDEVEAALAETFSPFFLFDSDEPSDSFRPGVGEPLGIFQVTPWDCDWTGTGMKIRIKYQYLFNEDGGYHGCATVGQNKHMGDKQSLTALVTYQDGVFRLEHYASGEWEWWYSGEWWECKAGVFLSPGKHHDRFHRRTDCTVSPESTLYWEKWDGAYNGGHRYLMIKSYPASWDDNQMIHGYQANVGEYHTCGGGQTLTNMLCDGALADFIHIIDVPGWDHLGGWANETAWNDGNFLGGDHTDPLGERWSKESPRFGWEDTIAGFDFDCDGVMDRNGPVFNPLDTTRDLCPFGVYSENGLKEMLDADGDGWGDACDLCPHVYSEDQSDADGDGVPNEIDICRCAPNPAQRDCNGNDIGDACDPVPCVAFVDYGVNDQVCLGANNFAIWTGTPTTIRIDTRAAAGVVVSEDGSPTQLTEHDVQVRWCDCSDFESVDICKALNCIHDNDPTVYGWHFSHSNWHMASLNSDDTLGATQDILESPPEPGPAKFLTTDCPKYHPDVEWSTWGIDSEITSLQARHCSPERPFFGDNDGQPAYAHGEGHLEERWWDWSNELWWRNPYKNGGVFQPGPFQQMQAPGNGFIWIRPEVENWSMEAGKNRDMYLPFTLHETTGKPNPILKKSWPGIFSDLPIDDVIDPVLEGPTVGLVVVPPEDVSRVGSFAYAPSDPAPGSAVGGLAVVEVDRSGANLRGLGRSVAVVAGTAPSAVGFASAAIRFPSAPGGGDVPLEVGIEGGPGLALFGGTLASGQAVNALWLGGKKGLDADGTAVWEFRVAPFRGEAAPAPRSEAGLVFDREKDRLLLFGGLLDDGSVAADCWSYDLVDGTWSEQPLPRDLPGLRGFETVLAGRTVYVLGGFDGSGARNGEVLAVDLDGERGARVVGSLADGPGARDGLAVAAWGGIGDLRLLVQGGVDEAGVSHSDAWELDPASGEWERVVEDCAGSRCPPASAWPLLWSSADGESLLLVPTSGDPASPEVFWVSEGGGRWRSNSEILEPPTTMDCDGDGVEETGTGKACTAGPGWWAEVGRMACGAPGGELVCSAPALGEATVVASFEPDGWEWLLDVEVREDGFAFAVTDSSLLVFDLGVLAAGAAFEPVAAVDLVVPGTCAWCGGPDFAFDVELAGDRVLVATVAGLHAFDAASPTAPTETGFLPGRGPVLDVEVMGDAVYLADGRGVTAAAIDATGVPVEVGRLVLSAPVLGVEVSREEWLLWALLPTRIRAFDLLPDPRSPVAKGQAVVAGLLSPRMKADGRWAYVSGLTNRAFFATAEGSVEARSSHAVRPWVEGRERHNDLAVRVDLLHNRLEVWQEVAP